MVSMHNFFSSGVVNSEAAALIYVLLKKRHFTFEQRTEAFNIYAWPRGSKPPAIHPSVCSGREGGLPKLDAHMRFSGSHTLHFAQVLRTCMHKFPCTRVRAPCICILQHDA